MVSSGQAAGTPCARLRTCVESPGARRGGAPGSTEGNYINWLTFADNAKSVVEHVTRIRNHPLVPDAIPIYGYICDVTSGKLVEVSEAMTAGKNKLAAGLEQVEHARPSRMNCASHPG
jgi:hypothetical protein